MSEICPKCGLPKELCTCEVLAREQQIIKVFNVTRRYGKVTTIIQGISKDADIKKILKELKHKLACGGTIKNDVIELQGNHKHKVKEILKKMGFSEEQIEVT